MSYLELGLRGGTSLLALPGAVTLAGALKLVDFPKERFAIRWPFHSRIWSYEGVVEKRLTEGVSMGFYTCRGPHSRRANHSLPSRKKNGLLLNGNTFINIHFLRKPKRIGNGSFAGPLLPSPFLFREETSTVNPKSFYTC